MKILPAIVINLILATQAPQYDAIIKPYIRAYYSEDFGAVYDLAKDLYSSPRYGFTKEKLIATLKMLKDGGVSGVKTNEMRILSQALTHVEDQFYHVQILYYVNQTDLRTGKDLWHKFSAHDLITLKDGKIIGHRTLETTVLADGEGKYKDPGLKQ